MRPVYCITLLLVSALTLPGCKRALDVQDVREFIDKADATARKRYAPEICALRGENFTLQLTYQTIFDVPPSELSIDRALYCRQAGRFSRLRQYRLERRSLEIDVDEQARTANVIAEYVETMPYYGADTIPATPDDFRDFVVIESRDESVVGIEGGDLVFLRAKVAATESELIPKSQLDLPYD